jgi:nucleoid-associated protein YgaU
VKNPLQAMLEQGVIPSVTFPQDSRYFGFATRTYTAPDGTMTTYLQRRYVPKPEAFAVIGQHTVVQGDRLDLLAAAYLGDPIVYWRLCDANGALAPDDLLAVIGRILKITLPQGVPGAPGA